MSSSAKILQKAFAELYDWIGELLDESVKAKYRIMMLEKIVKSDTEIGQLIRGMENDTGLGWEAGIYYALRCHWPRVGHLVWYRPQSGAYSRNPIEVLRTIQEEKPRD